VKHLYFNDVYSFNSFIHIYIRLRTCVCIYKLFLYFHVYILHLHTFVRYNEMGGRMKKMVRRTMLISRNREECAQKVRKRRQVMISYVKTHEKKYASLTEQRYFACEWGLREGGARNEENGTKKYEATLFVCSSIFDVFTDTDACSHTHMD